MFYMLKVDRAIYLINSTIANQLDWNEINEIVDEAKEQGHEVAMAIKGLKLEVNHILLELGYLITLLHSSYFI